MKAESTSQANPILALQNFGQSLWLDYIRRDLITSGELARLIREDGVRGLTSNPAIFEKAITGSSDYADALKDLSGQSLSPKAVYERLAIRDIQEAADLLGPVYEATQKRDGYVSLEVSPQLARDTRGTLEEARRLWALVKRPNVMIKVPGTSEGLPAIQQLISEGVNVNITLLFAQERYVEVAEAYIAGLEQRAARGGDLRGVASVASFFISRIDTLVDTLLTAKLKHAPANEPLIKQLLGKIAIANAKLTYRRYHQIFSTARWQALANRGAQTQRLLWASTSTKNPAYRDVVYVEELIGPDTVNTIPPATLEAFRRHGQVRKSLTENLAEAEATMALLAKVGISMQEVTDRLLDEAIRLFAEPFDKLLNAIAAQTQSARPTGRQSLSLPKELAAAVTASIEEWRAGDKVRRLWARDATLWTGSDEAQWLGWLNIADEQLKHIGRLRDLAAEVKKDGFAHILLLGMGGSSLCPEVLKLTFGTIPGFPDLHVLDSTDPSQIATFERRLDLTKTLVIVSSKSGSTLEPNIFKQYFFERITRAIGAGKAGSRFIAITDPGSKLQQIAEKDGFRHIYYGLPSVGGRYSALTAFGMVPAAAMGLDVGRFLEQTSEMVRACGAGIDPADNPGVVLGTILGTLARQGRDKVTLIMSPEVAGLGAWLEQLLAESTGKEGHGLIPIDREAIGAPDRYGSDRLFVYVALQSRADGDQHQAVSALERAGHPVVRITLSDKYDLGQEFFRWEIATAVAGSILGINAFNQPDVEASKAATRALTDRYEQTGSLPSETPLWNGDGIAVFADGGNGSALTQTVGKRQSLMAYLKAHLDRIREGDYFALLAYVEMNEANERVLQEIRHRIRDHKRIATCLGFGPRFLHSTGQAYKGGPNTGVFLQVTCDDAADLPIPGQKYTFGVVKAAQARGDFQVLAERGRRALRIHLGKDVSAGLAALARAVVDALTQARG
jgi:transaldolase/glucose-6-phosphate isomerase